MSQVLYNDLTKPTADFIKKDFPESHKVEATYKHKYGSIVAITDLKEGGVVASVQPKIDFTKYLGKNSNGSFTIDTNGVKKGEVSIEDLVPGLKTIINGDSKQNFSTEFQYKKDKVAFTVFGHNNKSYLTSLAFAINPTFTVGVQAEGNAKNTLKNVNATIIVRPRPDIFISVSNRFMDKQILLSTLYTVSPKLSVAADVTVDLKASDKSPSFNAGTLYKVDSQSSIKAKFNNTNKVNISYLYAANSNAKFAFGWNFNVANLKQGSTFGSSFNITL
ncbi:hypothetical protein ACTA71_007102 [Dictyostelium dimigraforme]